MSEHQERVIEEKKSLDDKLRKLTTFVQTELCANLDASERLRLSRQQDAMHAYSNILNERINSFPVL
ncbi:hypothetical protein KAR91_37115 [Candidatus Pacearchaeota archaeon]|nr:hypothetical protein [Candidatus Pacearchaeota archaeon]